MILARHKVPGGHGFDEGLRGDVKKGGSCHFSVHFRGSRVDARFTMVLLARTTGSLRVIGKEKRCRLIYLRSPASAHFAATWRKLLIVASNNMLFDLILYVTLTVL